MCSLFCLQLQKWFNVHEHSYASLQDFPSAKPSLGVFFARMAPRMRPRYYSISSSPVGTPQRLSITAAVVDSVAPCGRRHRGVATTRLAALTCDTRVTIPGALRTSTFRLPSDVAVPVVMVGPGTGLAPFRGFLQERAAKQAAGETLGPGMMFFGCRHPEHDYIYQQELEVRCQSAVDLNKHHSVPRKSSFVSALHQHTDQDCQTTQSFFCIRSTSGSRMTVINGRS